MNCCNNAYSKNFDAKMAQGDLADYHQNRIKKNSRPLINALKKLPLANSSLLDIGGGVGVTIFELFNVGIQKAIHVELSEHYSKTFCEESKLKGLTQKTSSFIGDFLELHSQIDSCDLVCLDKVFCCYPDYIQLVDSSTAKANRWYAYVIPKDAWWIRLADDLKNFFQSFRKDGFRTYVHSVVEIEQKVIKNGFKKIFQEGKSVWLTVLYERT